MKKCLIVGLDGFTWQVVRKLMEVGAVPTLASIINDGVSGTLKSVALYETAPSWTALYTGCLPEKSGIFGFHRYDPDKKVIKLNSYQDIKVPTVFDVLEEHNKRFISINMPMTYPSCYSNGIVVPGLLSPTISRHTVSPSNIYTDYIGDGYAIVNNDLVGFEDYIETAKETEQDRSKLAFKLMSDFEWDVLLYQIQATDTIQHRYWWSLIEGAEGYNDDAFDKVAEFYTECDKTLGKLIESAGADPTVFVVSDHGFCNKEFTFAPNKWLEKNGFLKRNQPKKDNQLWTRIKGCLPPLKKIAIEYGEFQKKIKNQKTRGFAQKVLNALENYIDIKNSQAVFLGAMGGVIYIANEGNEKVIADSVTKLLLDQFGPDSGVPIIKKIQRLSSNDVRVPALLVETYPGVECVTNITTKDVLSKDGVVDLKRLGTHQREGFYSAIGPNIQKGGTRNIDLVDILPTILSSLSVGIPNGIDGSSQDIFIKSEESIFGEYSKGGTQADVYSESEEDDIRAKLEDLGYH